MKIAILATFLFIMVGILAMPVEAHHRDDHDKGGGGSTASMNVTPDPVTVGESYQVHGMGFGDFDHVHLSIASPGCCSASNVFPDSNGEFILGKTAGVPGTYRFTAIVHSAKGKSDKLKVVATLEFEVLP